MKRSIVTVPWLEGLHLRQAVRLARLGQRFRSTISLRCRDRCADLRSILSILALCATMGATLEIEVNGDDEQEAAQSVEQLFVE